MYAKFLLILARNHKVISGCCILKIKYVVLRHYTLCLIIHQNRNAFWLQIINLGIKRLILKSHYAFNVNKLQETKSSLSLLMGSLQSHLHIDVLLIQRFGCFAKFERVKKFHNNKSVLICVYIYQETPCIHRYLR